MGVPRDNLTILGVAKALAARARRAPSADRVLERARLTDVVRYHPSRVTRAWPLWSARADTADTLSYRLDLDSALGATAVWFRPLTPRTDAPVTIVLHDDGRAAAADLVAEALTRGGQVVAVNLIFFGDMVPEQPASPGAEAVRFGNGNELTDIVRALHGAVGLDVNAGSESRRASCWLWHAGRGRWQAATTACASRPVAFAASSSPWWRRRSSRARSRP